MSDEPLGLPPGWPTAEHRARVATRARGLRNRRLAFRTTATALVVVVLGAGFALVRGGSGSNVRVTTASSTTATTTTRPPPPELQTVPVPTGWQIVDYGDARLAAPPDWQVGLLPSGTTTCPPDAGTGVRLYRVYLTSCSSMLIGPMDPGPLPPRAALTIHGIKLYLAGDSLTFISYAVPELGVTLTLHGSATDSILETLTSSSRRVVLGPGGAPAVPRDWHTVAYDGITMRVPPTWPVKRLGTHDDQPGVCEAPIFREPTAFIGNGFDPFMDCPGFVFTLLATPPTDGVWISAPNPQPPHSYTTSLVVGGLRLWVDTSTDPVLTIQPQRGDTELPALIEIGLGPDPSVARTILYSIRPSDRPG